MKIKNFPISQSVTITTIGSKADRCTIGYRRVNRMVQVAISYCAPDDKWKAKVGQLIVHSRLENLVMYDVNSGVISLPMGYLSDEDTQSILQAMFFGFEPD